MASYKPEDYIKSFDEIFNQFNTLITNSMYQFDQKIQNLGSVFDNFAIALQNILGQTNDKKNKKNTGPITDNKNKDSDKSRKEEQDLIKQRLSTSKDNVTDMLKINRNLGEFYSGLGGMLTGGITQGLRSATAAGIQGFTTDGFKGGVRGAAIGFGNGSVEGGNAGAVKASNAFTAISGGLQFFSKSLSVVTGAIDGLIGGFAKLTFVVISFVKAFNPALVEMFNQTIKDLMAVVGAFLQPFLTALMNVTRALADSLIPVLMKFRPAFEAFGNMVVRFLVPVFQSLLTVLNSLAPVINALAPQLEVFAQKFGEALGSLIEGLLPILNVQYAILQALLPIANIILDSFTAVGSYLVGPLLGALSGLTAWFTIYLFSALSNFSSALATATLALRAYSSVQGASAGAAGGAAAGGRIGMLGGPWGALIGVAIGAIAGGLTSVLGSFFTKQEAKFDLTGDSYGAAARSAQYSSVEELSRNLIKAAFSGSANDKLGTLVNQGKQQVELLQQIAGRRAPAPAGAPAAIGVLP